LPFIDPHHGTYPKDTEKSEEEKCVKGANVRRPPTLLHHHPPTETKGKNQVRCTKAPLCSSKLRGEVPMTPTPTPISAVTTVPITAQLRKISAMRNASHIYSNVHQPRRVRTPTVIPRPPRVGGGRAQET